ncbi:unnamed protein product [Closterium sp. Naga37s-1]|nr:unnamed protein product [Closterium sp. Naga37s-1]
MAGLANTLNKLTEQALIGGVGEVVFDHLHATTRFPFFGSPSPPIPIPPALPSWHTSADREAGGGGAVRRPARHYLLLPPPSLPSLLSFVPQLAHSPAQIEKQVEEVLFDDLHDTAFQFSPLGRTVLDSADNVRPITRDDLEKYIATHYTGPRMVSL